MSADFPGLVETSSSLGVAETEGDRLTIRTLSPQRQRRRAHRRHSTRSPPPPARPARELEAPRRLPGLAARTRTPRSSRSPAAPSSARFGAPPNITAVHGGLECALIGAKKPGLEMLSFGPRDRGPARARRAAPHRLRAALHAAAGRAPRRAVALTSAAKTPRKRSSCFQASWSSHWTPRRPGVALELDRLDDPVVRPGDRAARRRRAGRAPGGARS